MKQSPFNLQVEVGKCYEMVVTNTEGLYRNRFGDIVKIEGYMGNTPTYTFQDRYFMTFNINKKKCNITPLE